MSYAMSPWRSICSRRMPSVSGPIEEPSPKTSSVTPCRMSLCPRPSAMREGIAQLSMFTNPGATASPRASISWSPWPSYAGITAAIVSPSIATSAAYGSPPEPS